MKILIIEDERRTADLIARFIKQYNNSFSVIGVIDSVEKGVNWFIHKTEMPDLILADIQLTDGSSFDLFDQVNLELPVIFITAYNEFALNAFRLNSIDYLLKPFNFSDLKKAFDKFIKTKDAYLRANLTEYNQIISTGHKPFKRRFLVRSGIHYKYLSTDEIAYFFAEEGLVFARLLKGGRSIVENNITELNGVLDPEQFFQVNRNTIASIKAINKFSGYFNRRLILQLLPDNYEVIVSRERVHVFKEWLNK
ncbi:MAG TPA: DNA-binding response regulator [Bacteroidales bacterium]|jgi:two-component system, LytTR family, response regulator LytT|nr:DNA-binding response regulator [Bacteroidales bacterium]HBZ19779.1 DNA-binding response regulator [Bacteroidales bacterium]